MRAPAARGLRAAALRRSVAWAPPQATPAAARAAVPPARRSHSSLPPIAQSSFWKSLVPKPLRRNKDGTLPVATAVARARTAKEWNPATFYIFLFLFIGSMAIQMIALKKDFDQFMRQADAKIGLLREVLERVQQGEAVNVETALGTGDAAREAEWDAVLQEMERDEVTKSFRRQAKKADKAAAEQAAAEQAAAGAHKPAKPAAPTNPAAAARPVQLSSFY